MPRVSFRDSHPVGAILAGGLGRRLGVAKATAMLNGRPMLHYPLRALQDALGGAVIVAKADSELPNLAGTEVWIEPDEPRHPLTGLVHALEQAGGRPVLICACDLPLVPASLVRELAAADPRPGKAVIASGEGRLQPLLGCYQPAARPALVQALERGASVTEAVAAIGGRPYEVPEPAWLFNVNTPAELRRAEALLSDQPKVKS
jgi:molybdopterin-guanine dinucleotide biosynthesis protein A